MKLSLDPWKVGNLECQTREGRRRTRSRTLHSCMQENEVPVVDWIRSIGHPPLAAAQRIISLEFLRCLLRQSSINPGHHPPTAYYCISSAHRRWWFRACLHHQWYQNKASKQHHQCCCRCRLRSPHGISCLSVAWHCTPSMSFSWDIAGAMQVQEPKCECEVSSLSQHIILWSQW